ncbi:MAG: hypothetical protein O3B31_01155 [Chloroflexi bacterium]|nr:hypothetical protein [Chloroflexota bacterium]MDA1001948.1 hypothetical protein [Chloroflexota bacterium]
MFDWIPFAAGGVVMLWALASFAMAVSGGPRAGLHEVVADGRRAEAAQRIRRERTFQAYRLLNYGLALGLIAATIALFGAAIFLS